MDCACKNGAITANAAVSNVPAMLLTSTEIAPDDRKLLLSVDVQTAVPEAALDKRLKSDADRRDAHNNLPSELGLKVREGFETRPLRGTA